MNTSIGLMCPENRETEVLGAQIFETPPPHPTPGPRPLTCPKIDHVPIKYHFFGAPTARVCVPITRMIRVVPEEFIKVTRFLTDVQLHTGFRQIFHSWDDLNSETGT